MTLRLIVRRLIFHLPNLPWSYKNQGPFLIIIIIPPIANIATNHILQKHRINPEIHFHACSRLPFSGWTFRQIQNTHQRMQSLYTTRIIVIRHAIKIHDFIHNWPFSPHKITQSRTPHNTLTSKSVIMVRKTVIRIIIWAYPNAFLPIKFCQ
ncbi:hypothetical protein D3C86_1248940 [compost metagenome]